MTTNIKGVGALAIVACLAVLAGCASTGTSATAVPPASAASASSVPSSPDCNSQAISWRDNGGKNQLAAVAADLANVSKASGALGADLQAGTGSSEDESALQTAAASLQSDSQTAQANLPPSCVPNMKADYGAALNNASKAALDSQNAVSEFGSGNYSVAAGDMSAANAALAASGTKFQAATSDIQAFNNS